MGGPCMKGVFRRGSTGLSPESHGPGRVPDTRGRCPEERRRTTSERPDFTTDDATDDTNTPPRCQGGRWTGPSHRGRALLTDLYPNDRPLSTPKPLDHSRRGPSGGGGWTRERTERHGTTRLGDLAP